MYRAPSSWTQWKQSVAAGNTGAAASCFARTAPSVVCVPTGGGSDGSAASLRKFVDTFVAQREFRAYEETVLSTVVAHSQLVEEAIVSMVHDDMIDWVLPGVKPTRKRIVFPLVTVVHFDADGKIQTMHMYWDQATVLRQIGVLPNSLYCKSNSSEVTLPVLGPRITDRLQEPYNNLVLNGMDGDSDSAPTAAAPEAVMTKPHHSASDIFNQHELPAAVRPQSGQSDMSYSNNNIFGSAADPITGSRPSSRVIHRPGGPSSNIFSTEPEPLKTGVAINPQRYHSNVVFGGPEEQPLPTQQPQQMQYLEREAPAAAAPSSVADPVTGSRPSSKVIHRPGGPTNDIFNMEPQAAAGSRPRTGSNGRRDPNWSSINAHEEVPLPTTQRKHASFGQNGTQSRGEYGVGGGIGMRTGRGGYHNPNETQHEAEDRKAAAAAAEAAAVVAASGARGMVGAGRNHNAMSEEAPLKPSSKVLAPPGGKTSVFFG